MTQRIIVSKIEEKKLLEHLITFQKIIPSKTKLNIFEFHPSIAHRGPERYEDVILEVF